MKKSNYQKGCEGEKIARSYLEKKGYRILFSNYRTKLGEIDFLASNQEALAVIEVKSGWRKDFPPQCQVSKQKKKRIQKALEFFLYKSKMKPKAIHFEVIAILMPEKKISHFCEEFFDF